MMSSGWDHGRSRVRGGRLYDAKAQAVREAKSGNPVKAPKDRSQQIFDMLLRGKGISLCAYNIVVRRTKVIGGRLALCCLLRDRAGLSSQPDVTRSDPGDLQHQQRGGAS